MAEAVRRHPLIAGHTFDPTPSHVEFVVGKVALGHVVLLLLRVSPVSTILIHSFITNAVNISN